MAMKMITELCGQDAKKWAEVEHQLTLELSIGLWDAIEANLLKEELV
jgi:hypothetical protein